MHFKSLQRDGPSVIKGTNTWRNDNVIITSKRRRNVVMT